MFLCNLQLELVQWMLSSDPTERPSAEQVATSEILKQIKDGVQATPDQDYLPKLTQGHALPLSSRTFCNPIDEYLSIALRGPCNCGYGVVVTTANETAGHAVSYWLSPKWGTYVQFCL